MKSYSARQDDMPVRRRTVFDCSLRTNTRVAFKFHSISETWNDGTHEESLAQTIFIYDMTRFGLIPCYHLLPTVYIVRWSSYTVSVLMNCDLAGPYLRSCRVVFEILLGRIWDLAGSYLWSCWAVFVILPGHIWDLTGSYLWSCRAVFVILPGRIVILPGRFCDLAGPYLWSCRAVFVILPGRICDLAGPYLRLRPVFSCLRCEHCRLFKRSKGKYILYEINRLVGCPQIYLPPPSSSKQSLRKYYFHFSHLHKTGDTIDFHFHFHFHFIDCFSFFLNAPA